MNQGSRTAQVSVLIEKTDGSIKYVNWKTTGSIKALHKKVKETYQKQFPGCQVSFGNALCVYSYGAH
jgi:hypothetical protein